MARIRVPKTAGLKFKGNTHATIQNKMVLSGTRR